MAGSHGYAMSKVRVRVISQEGHYSAGQKVDDDVVFDWDTHEINGRICLHSLYSMMSKIYALAPRRRRGLRRVGGWLEGDAPRLP